MTRRRNPRFTRRQVLASMGVGAAVAPFVPLLESAAGGPEKPPKRLVVVFTPHGTIKENWRPTGSSTDFTLSPILQPLQPFKDRLVVIEGLDIKPQPPFGGPHTVGPAYLFTGSRMLEGDTFKHPASGGYHGWGSSISIDQACAQVLSADALLPSLEVGVQTNPNDHPGGRISYAGPNLPLAPEPDPARLFQSLFGEQNLSLAEQERLREERLAVIDVVKPQLDALTGKVNTIDAQKIESHLAAIELIEKKVSALYDCDEPELGPPLNPYDYALTEVISGQQIDLLVEAMSCGLTNVATIMYRLGENDNQAYPFLPGPHANDEHHLATHAPDNDHEAKAMLTGIYTWYSTQLALLAQKLDAIVEPDGSTMLDNTLIVWGSEIAKGNTHAWEDMSFLLIGGGGGSIIGNRYHRFGGLPHNRLLVTVANAMGLEVQTFGDLDPDGGILPGILA